MNHRLGIDLGGTSAKIGLVDARNRLVRQASVPTAGFPAPAALAKRLAAATRELLKGTRVKHVGVGVAGDIDFDRGVIRVSPNLGWKNVRLKSLLEKDLRLKVTVDNDANVAAWGLYKTQVDASVKHLIVATLGTGVGGGIILGGHMYRGATNTAGEIGHMVLDENGPLCNCGNRGCLETYVGGPHIVKRVKAALAMGRKSSLQSLYKADPDEITPHAVALAAHKGDAYARSIWDDVGRKLGLAFGSLIYIFNPQLIVFTGGVAQARGLILRPMKKVLAQKSFKVPVGAARIRVAESAPHVGVIGASLL